jgi:hypothetical protein
LEYLLRDWPRIAAAHPGLELAISYGWHLFEQFARMTGRIVEADQYKARIMRLADQPGIHFLGGISREQLAQLYWRARYWILPLPESNADAELYCMTGRKAIWCRALPVVNPYGALGELPARTLAYEAFVSGQEIFNPSIRPPGPSLSWAETVDRYWWPILNGEEAQAA